uniref:Twisted gastrulation protein homolog 1-A-like n=2 Tax=Sinocyclocheilus rhinocerous TaxID=307959 RepID=A0A673MXJ6_9TELE
MFNAVSCLVLLDQFCFYECDSGLRNISVCECERLLFCLNSSESGDMLLIMTCVSVTLLLSGMCNPKNLSDTPATAKSTVEELQRPIPSLFRALTDGDAPINMLVVSFPAAEELSYQQNLLSFLETLEDAHHNVSLPGNSIHASYDTQDELCTVVYLDDCVSMRQCKQYCESMGGSKYRWFHNACCECIGPECLDYGSKAVRCMNCLF